MKLIVDLSQFVHANYHTTGKSSGSVLAEAVENNIVRIVENIRMATTVESVSMAVDSDTYFRHVIFPEYKKKSKSDSINFKSVIDHLATNYKILKCDGLEADDVIYLFCSEYKENALIISADKDALQTVSKTGAILYDYRADIAYQGQYPLWKMKLIFGSKDNLPSLLPPRTRLAPVEKMLTDGMTVAKVFEKYGIDVYGEPAQLNGAMIIYDVSIYLQHVDKDALISLAQKIAE
jgi:5'-3' exonuclease